MSKLEEIARKHAISRINNSVNGAEHYWYDKECVLDALREVVEECAKVCESFAAHPGELHANLIAAAIRKLLDK